MDFFNATRTVSRLAVSLRRLRCAYTRRGAMTRFGPSSGASHAPSSNRGLSTARRDKLRERLSEPHLARGRGFTVERIGAVKVLTGSESLLTAPYPRPAYYSE